MKLPTVTTDQMRLVDRWMIETYRIELLQMMEHAGRHLATLARLRFLQDSPEEKRVLVLAGGGGNGGGGLAAARWLHNWGAHVRVWATRADLDPDRAPGRQMAILRRMGIPIESADAATRLPAADLILDAVIGYGLRKAPIGAAARLIHLANEHDAPILSLDVPSGLDATSGEAFQPHIRAAATLTLALPKTGLLVEGNEEIVGELYVADIGVPPALYERLGLTIGPVFAQSDILRIDPHTLEAQPFIGAAVLALPTAFEALNRLITAVGRSLDLTEILREAARAVVETLAVEASGLFLYDPDTKVLTLVAGHGLPKELEAQLASFAVTGTHLESVVQKGEVQIYHSPAQVPELAALGLPALRPDWRTYLCAPLTARGTVMGIMCLFGRRALDVGQEALWLYRAIGEQIGLAVANARLYELTQRLAITDPLTGAFNRRYLDEFLTEEVSGSFLPRQAFALIMLDIDGFKAYNDAHGHLAGDEALRQVVWLMRRMVRGVDIIARYGGEEFIVLLPDISMKEAHAIAERIRAAIAEHGFPEGHLTASLGVLYCATVPGNISPKTLLAMVDYALYEAKHQGRNRVCLRTVENVGASDSIPVDASRSDKP